LNSTYEGLPHVVLEAMGLGLPVVATAVGGTPELVQEGDNGRLIAVSDDGVLANTLAWLCTDAVERSRLAKGAKEAALRFSHEQMVEATEAVLRGVVCGLPISETQGHRADRHKTESTR
jgi:glycosyltransferase involved in cell wall biosynthesis